jgi:hypothetical protein
MVQNKRIKLQKHKNDQIYCLSHDVFDDFLVGINGEWVRNLGIKQKMLIDVSHWRIFSMTARRT